MTNSEAIKTITTATAVSASQIESMIDDPLDDGFSFAPETPRADVAERIRETAKTMGRDIANTPAAIVTACAEMFVASVRSGDTEPTMRSLAGARRALLSGLGVTPKMKSMHGGISVSFDGQVLRGL